MTDVEVSPPARLRRFPTVKRALAAMAVCAAAGAAYFHPHFQRQAVPPDERPVLPEPARAAAPPSLPPHLRVTEIRKTPPRREPTPAPAVTAQPAPQATSPALPANAQAPRDAASPAPPEAAPRAMAENRPAAPAPASPAPVPSAPAPIPPENAPPRDAASRTLPPAQVKDLAAPDAAPAPAVQPPAAPLAGATASVTPIPSAAPVPPENTPSAPRDAAAVPPAQAENRPALGAPPAAAPLVTTASLSPLPSAIAPEGKNGKKHPVFARDLFSAVSEPAPMAARAIGFYAKGCLAGAQALPVNGPAWQAMRLSRNRNWGHPALVSLIERFAADAKAHDGWPGLLVGDMSQPRGGPMPYGHASHQVGLDVDMWFKPIPDRELTREERDNMPFETVVGDDNRVIAQVWTPAHEKLLRRAVSYREVDRVFVHPAIKKKLCDTAGEDRAFLHKIKPIWGHDAHFHVRMACPQDNPRCENQPPLKEDEGCGKELDQWLKVTGKALAQKLAHPNSAVNLPDRRNIKLEQLPAECAAVVSAGAGQAAAR